MRTFYLTPTAISDLALLIFAVFITGYLAYLIWQTRQKRPFQTIFLALAFAFISGYILLDFLNQTLYPDLAYWFLPLQSVSMTIGMVWLLQFAYRMPMPNPQWRRESRLVFGVTLLLPLWEIGYAAHRYIALTKGNIVYRPGDIDFLLVAVFIWLIIIFLRQTVHTDTHPSSTAPGTSVWRKLWKPQNRAARAARRMAFITLLPVALTAVLILQSKYDLSTTTGSILLSVGLLFAMLLFILVYLNYLSEQTNFMIRLSAITLVFFLGVLVAVGQAMTPSFIASYNNDNLLTAPQTIRFTPNANGGYNIAKIPYNYERFYNAYGEEIPGKQLTYGEELHVQLPLSFEFPFYNQTWSELFMNKRGYVAFGKVRNQRDTKFRYGSAPSIYMVGTGDLIQTEKLSGMYAHEMPDHLTLTWLEMSALQNPDQQYTLQLRLYDSGIFEITVINLPATTQYDIYDRWKSARLLGALPGVNETVCDTIAKCVALFSITTPEHIRFNDDLAWSGGTNGTIEDYHLDFRTALHNFLMPLFWLILFSAALVIAGLPLAFRQNLVKPLNNLLAGVQQVNNGRLDTHIPVIIEDEFGYLTHSFNKMAADLNNQIINLEDRVAKRTMQLSENAAQLADTTAYLNNILRNASDYAIITIDRKLRVTYINPIAERLYSIIAAEAMGQRITTILEMDVDSDRFRKGMNHASTYGVHQYSITHETVDGTRHIAARLSGIFNEQAELIGYAHFSQDVTDRLHTESQLLTQQRAIAVLEDRAQIGQELHDRLGQVFGFISLQSQATQALFATGKQDDGDRALARLASVAQDAHGQVREFILGMRGSTAGQQNFWDALQAYADKLQRLYQMQVTLTLPLERPSLLSPDKELHLLRIIQEALMNARRHSGVDEAQVVFRQEGDVMRVMITDAGCGFNPPASPIAHRPFAETLDISQLNSPGVLDENGREHFGLLGMHEHAAALDGKLQIHSRPGAGTQIILAFPLDPQGEKAAAALANLPNLRVLLVDDQSIFLEGLSNLLTAYGLQVVGMAHDGLQAQKLARSIRPDVIVMDIHMPVCDGITATRQIKKEFPDVDIVMLSVSAEEELLFEALQAGASGYLLKSMQAKEFFLLISNLANGVPPLAPELAGKVLNEFRNRLQTDVTLTDEQTRLLALVAQGLTYFQISMELNASERTVQRRMKKILQLLHLSNRAEAAAYAQQRGL